MIKLLFKRTLLAAFAALLHLGLNAQDLELTADPFYNNDLFVNSTRIPVMVALKNISKDTFNENVDIYYRILGDSARKDVITSRESLFIFPEDTLSKLYYVNFDKSRYTGKRVVIQVWVESSDSQKEVAIPRPQAVEIVLDETASSEADFIDFTLPETARLGDLLPIKLKMRIDGTDYTDERPLEVYYMVVGKPASQKTIYRENTPIRGKLKETVEIDTVIEIDGQHFSQGGGNVVIVWPIGFIKAPSDSSVSDTIAIDWPLLVDGDAALNILDVYPSISQGDITITSKDLKIERVRIFGANGKSYNVPYNGPQMQLQYLNAGAYTLEVSLENGTVVRRQIVFMKP